MSMENVIQFEAVHKSFGNLEVLKGIDMSIQKGQVVTLIGPSGGGKSTMLRCINGLEVPTSGKVLVNGIDITAPKTDMTKIRKGIGMVFQHFNLFPHLTVMENMIAQAGRLDREGGPVPGQAFRGPATAYRHRARTCHGAGNHALRRADQRP